MTELIIKSEQAEAVRAEIATAIDGQRRLVREGLENTRANLDRLEQQYGLTTEELLAQSEQESFDDSNLDFHDWIGESKTLALLEAELRLLDDIRIC